MAPVNATLAGNLIQNYYPCPTLFEYAAKLDKLYPLIPIKCLTKIDAKIAISGSFSKVST
jgi:hypothetical protein